MVEDRQHGRRMADSSKDYAMIERCYPLDQIAGATVENLENQPEHSWLRLHQAGGHETAIPLAPAHADQLYSVLHA